MTTTEETTDAVPDSTESVAEPAPAGEPTSPGLWKRGGAAVAMLALGTLTLFAVERPTADPHSPKLDRALTAWTAGGNSGSVRVIIQTRPGAASGVMERLRPVTATVHVSSTPDLLIADLSTDGLTKAAADADVVRVSRDGARNKPVSGTSTRTSPTRSGDHSMGWGPVKVLNLAAISLDGKEVTNRSHLP